MTWPLDRQVSSPIAFTGLDGRINGLIRISSMRIILPDYTNGSIRRITPRIEEEEGDEEEEEEEEEGRKEDDDDEDGD